MFFCESCSSTFRIDKCNYKRGYYVSFNNGKKNELQRNELENNIKSNSVAPLQVGKNQEAIQEEKTNNISTQNKSQDIRKADSGSKRISKSLNNGVTINKTNEKFASDNLCLPSPKKVAKTIDSENPKTSKKAADSKKLGIASIGLLVLSIPAAIFGAPIVFVCLSLALIFAICAMVKGRYAKDDLANDKDSASYKKAKDGVILGAITISIICLSVIALLAAIFFIISGIIPLHFDHSSSII
jgi:uncharacterized membrane protein